MIKVNEAIEAIDELAGISTANDRIKPVIEKVPPHIAELIIILFKLFA